MLSICVWCKLTYLPLNVYISYKVKFGLVLFTSMNSGTAYIVDFEVIGQFFVVIDTHQALDAVLIDQDKASEMW